MLPVAVFDIDGVLADVRHRLHLVAGRPKDWPGFFAAAGQDGELVAGTGLVRALLADHEIRYLTGRPERLRAVTTQWLAARGLPDGLLAMRPDRDFRPARVFKHDQLATWLAAGARIDLVVDDDPQVLQMVAELGLRTLAADWQDTDADAREVLRVVQEELGRS